MRWQGSIGGLALALAVAAACATTGPGEHANASLVYTPCTGSARMVAIQDGTTGLWTEVLPSDGKYYISYTQPKGGLMVVGGSGGYPLDVRVVYGLLNELVNYSASSCTKSDYATYNVPVKSLEFTGSVEISMGGTARFERVYGDTVLPVDAAGSTADLLGVFSGSPYADNFALKFILRRGIQVNAVAPLDFKSSEAFASVKPALSITGNASKPVVLYEYYRTASGFQLWVFGTQLTTSGPPQYAALPASRMMAGDLYRFYAWTESGLPDGTWFVRRLDYYWHDPVDRALVFQPAPPRPTFSFASVSPYVRFRVQLTLPDGASGYLTAGYSGASVWASTAYLGTTPVDLTFPDFTGVHGWDNIWAPHAGTQGEWGVSLYRGPAGSPTFNWVGDGKGYQSEQWSGFLTP